MKADLYDHTAEAILFAGIMWWLIKWIARTVTEVGEESPPPSDFTVSMTQMDTGAAQRVHERDLVTVSSAHAYAAHAPAAPVTVHCPACGFSVNAAPQPLPFTAECPNCRRHVSVRGDGPGRLSIVVSEPRV